MLWRRYQLCGTISPAAILPAVNYRHETADLV